MRKFTLLLFIIFIFVVFLYVFLDKTSQRPAFTAPSPRLHAKAAKEEKPIERIGEKIVYGVILGRVPLGRAVFTHLPHAQLDGKRVSLMTFETKLARFSDLETIYSDTNSFLPLKVERKISTWPILEKITEHYDQENFILTIRKSQGRKKGQAVIRKNSPIHNAVILPFYVRRQDALNLGWSMIANLPGQQFEIKLVSIEELKVPAGAFKAYRFESNPKHFEIWLSADERKIPLKIKGAGTFGYTLVMKEYSK